MTGERRDLSGRERRLQEVLVAYIEAAEAGQSVDRDALVARYPEFAGELSEFFAGRAGIERLAEPLRARAPAPPNSADTGSQAPTLAPAGPSAATGPGSFGDYELLEEIARGGMGVVYKARQISLNRIVALKMILSGQLASDADVERFYREAQTAASLQHPNIVAIHEVGQHDGQHYFSMDYVEGHSLAEIVREHPLPPTLAARYVQAIALAIEYAHQQGTLHRDLKPANVLIDQVDQPRVTDFGLAKRLDRDAGLTASGAVVGTPSYMPPEQAGGKRAKLSPASDVYSLGAILYELVTGRPPFQAATPVDTLLQVLEAEPAAPRLLNPGISRDLETIILKCLAKEPARRYGTAQQLADDLRACQEGRPIKARRPPAVERLVRWLRKQRRGVLLSAVTAAASLLLVVGAVFGWQWYAEWRQGQFVLTTDGLALEGEVLDEQDEPVLPPFTVPTRHPVSVLAGEHRLRISGPRRFSEDYRFLVERGLQRSFEIGPSERELWDPLDVTKGYEIVELDGRSDVIQVTDQGLRRINGATGKPIWDKTIEIKIPEQQNSVWSWQELKHEWQPRAWVRELPVQPWLVRPAPDLDGDGTRYLVWASRTGRFPWLLAVSAKEGTVKWGVRSQAAQGNAAICPPIATEIDGKPALIVVCAGGAEAIAGKDGRSIWRRSWGEVSFARQGYEHLENYGATVTRVGGKHVLLVAGRGLVGLDVETGKDVWPVRDLGFQRFGPPVFVDLFGKGELAVLLISNKSPARPEMALTALSSATGQTLWQTDVRVDWIQGGQVAKQLPQAPMVADLDGDGKPKIVVPYNRGPTKEEGWVGLEVLDGDTGQTRWRRRLSKVQNGPRVLPQYLIGPDLDGDGHRDIFTAALIDGDGIVSPEWYLPLLLVEASSGADGRTLWRYLQPVSKSRVGPGRVSPLRFGPPGPDGQPQLVVNFTCFPGHLTWSRGGDAQAQTLLFSLTTGKVAHTWPGLVDVDTADFNGDGIADLYGLRLDEAVLGGNMPQVRTTTLHAARGSPPERWRLLGAWQPHKGGVSQSWEGPAVDYVAPPHADLDGDGIPDRLVFSPGIPAGTNGWSAAELAKEGVLDSPLRAYSGKDGHQLWKADPTELIEGSRGARSVQTCSFLECRDLDGDGRPEVLFVYQTDSWVQRSSWLAVLSGRNGKVLWKENLGAHQVVSVAPGLMDWKSDGRLAVIVWATTGPTDFQSSAQEVTGSELRALDGRDGRLLWRRELPFMTGAKISCVGGKEAGAAEVVVTAGAAVPATARGVEVSAFNGKDGQPRWTWQLPHQVPGLAYYPVMADLDGDGRRSFCLLTDRETNKNEPIDGKYWQTTAQAHLISLDRDGLPQWSLDLKPHVVQKTSVGSGTYYPLAEEDKAVLGLWSHDLKGDGKEELVFINGDKVQALNLASGGRKPPEKPLWEWPLPNGAGEVLDIHPAGNGQAAVVVVRSRNVVYGLDGPTGRLRWRCDGPGRPVACVVPLTPTPLPPGERGRGEGDLPTVWFHASKPESTICRQALPVGEDGKYLLPPAAFIDRPADDVGLIVSLPWIGAARQRAIYAVWPGIACLGLVLYCAWKRRWRTTIGLLVVMVLIALAVAAVQLTFDNRFEEQRYSWSGWYWLWPYVLSAGREWTPRVLLAGLAAWLLWRGLRMAWLYWRGVRRGGLRRSES
jgi:outer membrane protein assembly factor BamB/tRNA A-37 threonylcarbamoyl transferase component Bud32